MRMGPTIALAAMIGAAPAAAQVYDDGGYGGYDGGYDGYYGQPLPDERDYGTAPPPPGARRPMPAYRDNGNWSRSESWSSTDARDDAERPAPPPPVPPRTTARGNQTAYRNAQADYRARLDAWNRQYGTNAIDPRDRARVDRWRARADACEGGDRAACDGPE